MNVKYLIPIILIFAFLSFVSAGSFMPTSGDFAFTEVENHTLHAINFTVPVEYKVTDSGDDFIKFKNGKEKLSIKVVKNGKIKKVNSTKKVKASKTMLGAQKGYLVDRNGSYTFSYKQGKYLVTLKSENMPLIVAMISKDSLNG